MKSIIKVSSSDLLIKRDEFVEGWQQPDVVPYRYAQETGFHVYGKLNLHLELSAADDMRHAKQYLKVIQAYTAIADACAGIQGSLLLEVQGEVIHLLLPGQHDAKTVDRLLAFCIALTQIVYSDIKPMAGENWQSFVMATDHGEAILIENGNGASDSIVSLGPAANAPAKQLPRTSAGCLSIRSDTLELVYADVDGRKEWVPFDLRNPSYTPELRKYSNEQAFVTMDSAMRTTAAMALNESKTYDPTVRRLTEFELSVTEEPDVSTPLQVQGFCMRSDLDGFTADVQEAFDREPEAVKALVERFTSLMGFVDAYIATRKRSVIRLPWAGDCANMVLMPAPNHTYDFDRAAVPATEPSDWHAITSEKNASGHNWRDLLLEGDWAVAVVGGGDSEGNEGRLLIASMHASKRQFRIVAGWGARRSLDALDATGIGKRDTVVHKEDYSALSENFQPHFSRVDSNFYKAHDLDAEKLKKTAIRREAKAAGISIPAVGIVTPKPQPHYQYQ